MSLKHLFLKTYTLLFAKVFFEKFNKFLFLLGAKGLGVLNFQTPYLTGEENFLSKFLINYDEDSFCILDVGANKGQFAHWVLQQSSKIRIISLEPNPSAFSSLFKLFSGNHRLTLVNNGAGSANEQKIIYDYSADAGSPHASLYSNVIQSIHSSESCSETEVSIVTVDSLLSSMGHPAVCLLKIDTEGHELEVLRGCTSLLSTSPPTCILLEFNEMNSYSNTHYSQILALLTQNYIPYRLLPGGSLLSLENEPVFYTEIYAYQNLAFIRKDFNINSLV